MDQEREQMGSPSPERKGGASTETLRSADRLWKLFAVLFYVFVAIGGVYHLFQAF